MRAEERPDIADHYGQRIIDLMTGRRSMPEVKYPERKGGTWHISDLDGAGCLGLSLCRARFEELPQIEVKSALQFLKGRVVERAISTHDSISPTLTDDIWGSADDFTEEFGFAEIKSTTADMDKFEPLTKYPWWAKRIMGYCHAYKVPFWNLVVVFLVGNLWTNKRAPTTIGIKAWKLFFSPDEIKNNWEKLVERKMLLENWLENPDFWPSMAEAGAFWSGTSSKTRCSGCQAVTVCPITNLKPGE